MTVCRYIWRCISSSVFGFCNCLTTLYGIVDEAIIMAVYLCSLSIHPFLLGSIGACSEMWRLWWLMGWLHGETPISFREDPWENLWAHLVELILWSFIMLTWYVVMEKLPSFILFCFTDYFYNIYYNTHGVVHNSGRCIKLCCWGV